MKKLAGTHWGANSKTVYTGAVRPTLEYGASAWATAAKTHTNKLDRVQNIGLRTKIHLHCFNGEILSTNCLATSKQQSFG